MNAPDETRGNESHRPPQGGTTVLRAAAYVAIVVAVAAALWVGGPNLLFTITADFACSTEGPAGFLGCTGVERGAPLSWVLASAAMVAVAAALIAIARGWLRDRLAGLAAVTLATITVFALMFASIDAFFAVVAVCHPDGQGGCLPHAVPSDVMAASAAGGAAIALAVSLLAVAAGRRPLRG
ncbi:hypothetical protein ACNI3K_11750 [Demequina sp. SO4-13]|uniref:hypothetical protein n=1 Tax=Demequina sp. SO4-13 TaxID=3401027 RepID=UPI003AF68918